MSRWTVSGAMLAGIGILLVMHFMYILVMVDARRYELLRLVLFGFPVVASFLVAFLAPRWKFVLAMSLSVFGATIGLISMRIYERLGLHVDNIGGLLETFVILLVFHCFMCSIGGVVGALSSRKSTEN